MQHFVVWRQVNNPFVNSHLKPVKCFCACAAWRFSCCYLHYFSRHGNRPSRSQACIFGYADNSIANIIKRAYVHTLKFYSYDLHFSCKEKCFKKLTINKKSGKMRADAPRASALSSQPSQSRSPEFMR